MPTSAQRAHVWLLIIVHKEGERIKILCIYNLFSAWDLPVADIQRDSYVGSSALGCVQVVSPTVFIQVLLSP